VVVEPKNGNPNPTFKTLLRISKGLEISLKELVDFPMS
jgi:DNA-binding phage protein